MIGSPLFDFNVMAAIAGQSGIESDTLRKEAFEGFQEFLLDSIAQEAKNNFFKQYPGLVDSEVAFESVVLNTAVAEINTTSHRIIQRGLSLFEMATLDPQNPLSEVDQFTLDMLRG